MSTPPIDPWKILGLESRDASINEIRSAHRKLVLKCHPDKVQDPELKAQKQDEFQKVQQAYEILTDDKLRLKCLDKIRQAELREQHNANTSAPRSSPKVYEVRTVDPTSRSYTAGRQQTPNVKIYASYSRSYEEPSGRAGPRYYDADIRVPRGGQSERTRGRDTKESEKRKMKKEREKEKDAEKAAKRKEEKARDKYQSQKMKRDKEAKYRSREGAYIESLDDDDESPRPRRSGRGERSSHRDETPPRDMDEFSYNRHFAQAYIHRSRTDMGPERSNSYHTRNKPPAVPTPPPAGPSAYAPPDDDEPRRSSARSRRGSADVPPTMPKDRSYHRSSREPFEEVHEAGPNIINASPAARQAKRYAAGPSPPEMASSPPRGMSRTNTMPTEIPTRPAPPPRRAQTYNESYGSPEYSVNRGRHRSKKTPQVMESTDSEEEYEQRRRPKHRSSRRTRSPEPSGGAEIRYQVDNGRTKLHSYSRRLDPESSYYYDDVPQRAAYGATYVSSSFPKVKTSKNYGVEDISYSHYSPPPYYPEGMPAARA